jgi:uncharacterized protein
MLNRRDLLVGSAGTVVPVLWVPKHSAVQAGTPSHRRRGTRSGTLTCICRGSKRPVEQRVDQLLLHADRMGIQRLVLSLGMPPFEHDPTPADLVRQNDEVLQAIAHAPDRLLGFVYLNPKHPEASQAELDRCVRDGPMVGVKLWVAIRCHEPELDPIVRRAVELQIPVLQHCYWRTGENLPGESTPADMALLAARHPDARFICAHTGNDWERGLRAIRAFPNVFAEICGSDPTAGFVEMAVRELGAARVIYGSDAGGRSFASQLAKVYSARLPEAAERLILSGQSGAPAPAGAGLASEIERSSVMIVDVNASLSRWPFRRTPCDQVPRWSSRFASTASGRPGSAAWMGCSTATWAASISGWPRSARLNTRSN